MPFQGSYNLFFRSCSLDNKVDRSPLSCLTAGLAADTAVEMSPDGGLHMLEMAIQRAGEGLTRWQAGSFEQLSTMSMASAEITLLQLIGKGGQSKTIKELAQATNRTDIPNIQYSLRKLASAGLTRKQGAGRSGVTYSLTEEGCHVSERLQDIRERLLLQALAEHPDLTRRLHSAAETLEELTELFGASARQAEAHSGS
ncbi:winged helix DNA-binding protein [Leisingera sp. F5]|uniref:winged helix DNA-binding protein n=1 Tax=Leisingera sp. F5 TaxID=1813816 RepID=UPI0025C33B08|nr:winged helix DNA-binding protein [Leisingera sp. F5]